MRLLNRDDFTKVLSETGVAFRWGMSMSHWNVLPTSNLKPWTPEEQRTLETAALRLNGSITFQLVRQVGRGHSFESVTAEPGKGFRIFTTSETQWIDKD